MHHITIKASDDVALADIAAALPRLIKQYTSSTSYQRKERMPSLAVYRLVTASNTYRYVHLYRTKTGIVVCAGEESTEVAP